MIFPAIVFGIFFAGMAFTSTRLLRMSHEQLHEALARSESQVGRMSRLNRAPVGGLVAALLGFVFALAVLAADHSDSRVVALMAGLVGAAWILATAATISAAYWGHPRRLVHPYLRDERL